jgi:hypothetical protein
MGGASKKLEAVEFIKGQALCERATAGGGNLGARMEDIKQSLFTFEVQLKVLRGKAALLTVELTEITMSEKQE